MSANLRRKSSSASGNGTAKAAAATAATTTPATGTVVSAPPTNGNGKPKSTRAVSLTKHKVDANAFEKLPADPTPQELRSAAINVSLADLEDRVADVRDSWETDSLFEDVIDSLTEDPAQVAAHPGCCGPEEAVRLRRELRELGPAVFCERTVDSGRYTAKKLLSAFGIKPPPFLEGEPDEAYFSYLSLAISRELSKRAKISHYNTVSDAVDLINRCNNIILITGAGISTSLGIPDFRSKGTGLYAKLAQEGLPINDPQEVFDISVFKEDPRIFYSVAKDIIPDQDRYTPTHKFIAMLHERGKLLTNYSQNIDNLEIKAGVPADRLIQCHGSFGSATCIQCSYQVQGEEIFPDIKAGKIPRCPRCIQKLNPPGGRTKRKRSAGPGGSRRRRGRGEDDSEESEYDIPQAGVMKPDITFFGEALPDAFSKRLTENDRDKVDLVIVIGTSLKVTPVSEIVSWLPSNVPQIYVSRQSVSHINFDIDLLGDCDAVVAELCRRLRWPLEHEMVPEGQRIDVRTEEGFKNRHTFTVRKPPAAAATPASASEDKKP